MYQSLNVDKAAEHVKNIIDSNRCDICDNSNGRRLRFPCGHSGCEDCVPATESCPLCLTPQDASTFVTPSIDEPQTLRSLNARNLFNAFQTYFGVDVNNRNRISEKLKVEKEVFPQCIQAPVKYYNKRKSVKHSTENKENITVYPGEEVSRSKMENSNANVKEWLNKCVKRKPLGDLSTLNNNVSITNSKQHIKPSNTQNKLLNRSQKKRNYCEIWRDENETYMKELHETLIKKQKVKSLKNKACLSTNVHKSKKDDSGIAVDDDDLIVLDDSQSVIIDKDANALLAVLEVEKNANCYSTTQRSIFSEISDKQLQSNIKVPFYKKSLLFNNCNYCKEYCRAVKCDITEQPNVSITVENNSYTAVINISKAPNTRISSKQSVAVQTDIKKPSNEDNKLHDRNNIMNDDNDSSKSNDIFLDEANEFSPVAPVNKVSNVIISESDSDDDMELSRSLLVTADVHRSYDEIILGDVANLEVHSKRPRRNARGTTPTSTDSSEKENYNPNRTKRSSKSKKKPAKKLRKY